MIHFSSKYNYDKTIDAWTGRESVEFQYSDGSAVEERLLAILKQANNVSLYSNELATHRTDWPSVYHFSRERANVLRPFYDRLPGATVLELGCGCGGVTRFLGECGADVVAVEGSRTRAQMAALRCHGLENVRVVVDNLQNLDFGPQFDLVTLIGVLEYARKYVDAPDPVQHVLELAHSFLKEDGLLVVAIENQLGLKYFAGHPEDHVGTPMYGINDLYQPNGVVTFGCKELLERIARAGFPYCETYAPFPDYKLPVTIIYPEGLDKPHPHWNLGALLANSVFFERQKISNPIFALERAWPVVARNDLTADLANSLILAAYRQTPSSRTPQGILAAHYSYNRAAEFAKEIQFVGEDNKIRVRKRAIGKTASLHQAPWMDEPYVPGTLWSDELHAIIQRPQWNLDQLTAWASPWVAALEVEVLPDADITTKPPEFSEYSRFVPSHFLDAIPRNLIVGPDGTSQFIDLEWEHPTPIPIELALFRGLWTIFSEPYSIAAPDPSVSTAVNEIVISILKAFSYTIRDKDVALFMPIMEALGKMAQGLEYVKKEPRESFLAPARSYEHQQADRSTTRLTFYWKSTEDPGYSEARTLSATYRLNGSKQDVTFTFPETLTVLDGLRLDVSGTPVVVYLTGLELHDAQGSAIWTWDGQSPCFAQCLGMLFARQTKDCGLLILATGGDPRCELDLPKTVLHSVGPGGRTRVCFAGLPVLESLPQINESFAARFRQMEAEMSRLNQTIAEKGQHIAELERLADLHREEMLRAEAQLELLKDVWLGDGPLDSL